MTGMMTAIWIALGFLALLSLAEAVAILALARELGLLSLRLPAAPALESGDGPELGSPLPAVSATPLGGGEPRPLHGASARVRVLVFLSTRCSSCRVLLAELNEVELAWPEHEFVPVVSGPAAEVAAMVRGCRYRGTVYRDTGEAMAEVGVRVRPSALVVDQQGTVTAQGVVNSREMMSSLLVGHVRVNHDLVTEQLDGSRTP